ncbi:hypothetical protein D9M68_939380 [compost metagenome]
MALDLTQSSPVLVEVLRQAEQLPAGKGSAVDKVDVIVIGVGVAERHVADTFGSDLIQEFGHHLAPLI